MATSICFAIRGFLLPMDLMRTPPSGLACDDRSPCDHKCNRDAFDKAAYAYSVEHYA